MGKERERKDNEIVLLTASSVPIKLEVHGEWVEISEVNCGF